MNRKNKKKGIFVTGTDTGVGKTVVAACLALGMKQQGLKVGIMKPIQTGAAEREGELYSADAEFVQKALRYGDGVDRNGVDRKGVDGIREDGPKAPVIHHHPFPLNHHPFPFNPHTPYLLKEPLAPLVAAQVEGVNLDPARILEASLWLQEHYSALVIEGAGGVMVPVNRNYLMIDLIKDLGFPVVLVARASLGTINHTLLTLEALRYRGIMVAGVVINQPHPASCGLCEETNPQVIRAFGQVNLLGVMPHSPSIDMERGEIGNLGELVKKHLDLELLAKALESFPPQPDSDSDPSPYSDSSSPHIVPTSPHSDSLSPHIVPPSSCNGSSSPQIVSPSPHSDSLSPHLVPPSPSNDSPSPHIVSPSPCNGSSSSHIVSSSPHSDSPSPHRSSLLKCWDKEYLWHPFTQMQDWVREDPLVVERGEGVYLEDSDGRRYIDGVASLWTNVHGHQKKEIDEAIRDQLTMIGHSTLLGLTHAPAIELARRLIQIAPAGLSRVFYSDSGATSCEIALKMAFQYWQQQGKPEKVSFIYFENSYHGDTLGAVSVGGIDMFHHLYHPLLFHAYRATSPYCYRCPCQLTPSTNGMHGTPDTPTSTHGMHGKPDTPNTQGTPGMPDVACTSDASPAPVTPTPVSPVPVTPVPVTPAPVTPALVTPVPVTPAPVTPESCRMRCLEDLERILQEHAQEISALIIEPCVQGAGGILVLPDGFLRRVRELCSQYQVLMICDEVAVGFGRTGRMFACEHEDVHPDLLCLAKGITGGYLPLAATLATEAIYAGFLGDYSQKRTFFHGHTYTGNPLACRAALANLDIFERERLVEKVQEKARLLTQGLQKFRDLPHVGDIRQKGLMAGIELVRDKASREPYGWEEKVGIRVIKAARKMGVIIRPLGDVIVLMPPLSISAAELDQLLSVSLRAIRQITEG